MNKRCQRKTLKNRVNIPEIIKLETNASGTKCRFESGIIVVYLKGRTAQTPFLKLCLQDDLKSVRA